MDEQRNQTPAWPSSSNSIQSSQNYQIGSLPPMTSALSSTIQGSTQPRFNEDGSLAGFIEGPWSPPSRIDPMVRSDAQAWVSLMKRRSTAAGMIVVQKWLSSLLAFVALKGISQEQVRHRMVAYGNMMSSRPEYLFSKESLELAARQFKWFPEYADLAEWFDRMDAEIAVKVRRSETVAFGRDGQPDRRDSQAVAPADLSVKELMRICDGRDRASGWAERDPSPKTPELPYEDIPPERRTRAQEIERIEIINRHTRNCIAWGERMRARDQTARKLKSHQERPHASVPPDDGPKAPATRPEPAEGVNRADP